MGPIVITPSALSLCLVAGAWLGSALYALGIPGGVLKFWSPALVATSMIAFVILHGCSFEGRRNLVLFVSTVIIVGWSFETISILTGFPFGSYHYTDVMAPFLGSVPVFVMPAYVVMGYVSWTIARILVLPQDDASGRLARFGVPAAAALLMVLWDLSMDPLRATIEQRWIWHDGGSHMGVPLVNFVGWFVVTWTMFQVYSLMRKPNATQHPSADPADVALLRLSAPLMYLALPVEYVLNPAVVEPEHAAIFVDSAQRTVGHIHRATAVLTLVTMVPVALVAAYRVWRSETMTAPRLRDLAFQRK